MIKGMKKMFLAAGLLAIGLLAGCGKKDGDTQVRVGYFPNVTHTQALFMKDQGALEKKWEGEYDVTWTSFNAGPAEVEALFAGELDLGYIGPVPAINAYVKSGGDIQIISNATNAGAVLIKRSDSDIETIADLAGKKVAIPQVGNTQHLCLLELLAENSLAPTTEGGDVEVVAVANSDVMNMMDQKNIDAAFVPEPWGSILEEQCGAVIVKDYDEVFMDGNYPTAVVVVRKEFMEEHPDLVKEFLEEHEAATDYINENKEELYTAINRQIEEATSKTYDVSILEKAFGRIQVTTDIEEEALNTFGKICYEQGFIEEEMKDGIVVEHVDGN